MAAESLAALADELDAMPRRARRAILGALTAEERAALDRRLAAGVSPAPPAINLTDSHSPWLAERVARARNGAPGMTAAGRQLLLRCVDPAVPAEATSGIAGRSLFEAVGGMLSPRKSRV